MSGYRGRDDVAPLRWLVIAKYSALAKCLFGLHSSGLYLYKAA